MGSLLWYALPLCPLYTPHNSSTNKCSSSSMLNPRPYPLSGLKQRWCHRETW